MLKGLDIFLKSYTGNEYENQNCVEDDENSNNNKAGLPKLEYFPESQKNLDVELKRQENLDEDEDDIDINELM